jgi:transcriptional regulator with XRE-family HTH domain
VGQVKGTGRDRKKWFDYLFESKGESIDSIAKAMGIKKDSLYRKLKGINGFSEDDIVKILTVLEMTFEEVFNK